MKLCLLLYDTYCNVINSISHQIGFIKLLLFHSIARNMLEISENGGMDHQMKRTSAKTSELYFLFECIVLTKIVHIILNVITEKPQQLLSVIDLTS